MRDDLKGRGMRTVVRASVEAIAHDGAPFAWRHELAFPKLGVRYTYIPKNGCSSFKLSLGVAEGWLADDADPHSISPALRLYGQLRTRRDGVRFVMLRDPASRLVSAFLDRFSKTEDRASTGLAAQGLLRPRQSLRDVSFRQFCEFVASQASRDMDPHWRLQADFLRGQYTHYLDFGSMDAAARWLEGLGVPFLAYRPHATSSYRPLQTPAADLPAGTLTELRDREGIVPRSEDVLDDEVLALVRKRYAADYELIARVEFV